MTELIKKLWIALIHWDTICDSLHASSDYLVSLSVELPGELHVLLHGTHIFVKSHKIGKGAVYPEARYSSYVLYVRSVFVAINPQLPRVVGTYALLLTGSTVKYALCSLTSAVPGHHILDRFSLRRFRCEWGGPFWSLFWRPGTRSLH